MQEKTIVNKIMKYLHNRDGCYCFKERGGLEVKTATGKTTALQDLAIRDINSAGGTATVVRSLDDVKQALSGLEAR